MNRKLTRPTRQAFSKKSVLSLTIWFRTWSTAHITCISNKTSANNVKLLKQLNLQVGDYECLVVWHTRVLGTSSNSIKGRKPCCVTNTNFCSGRWWKKTVNFWQADKTTSSDSSGLNDETNLLNSTACRQVKYKSACVPTSATNVKFGQKKKKLRFLYLTSHL